MTRFMCIRVYRVKDWEQIIQGPDPFSIAGKWESRRWVPQVKIRSLQIPWEKRNEKCSETGAGVTWKQGILGTSPEYEAPVLPTMIVGTCHKSDPSLPLLLMDFLTCSNGLRFWSLMSLWHHRTEQRKMVCLWHYSWTPWIWFLPCVFWQRDTTSLYWQLPLTLLVFREGKSMATFRDTAGKVHSWLTEASPLWPQGLPLLIHFMNIPHPILKAVPVWLAPPTGWMFWSLTALMFSFPAWIYSQSAFTHLILCQYRPLA